MRTRLEAVTFREHFDDWKNQIQHLQEQGYTFVPPSYYLQWYKKTVTPSGPIACCQIDDGLASIQLICDYMVVQGIPFGLGLIGRRQRKRIPEADFASWALIKSYVQSGYAEIQNHTYNMHNLTLSKATPTSLVEASPVLERPCWIDDGDVIYRASGDTRYWWDFSHIDSSTWGFPIWGTDPYDGVTPIISTFVFKAKVSFTLAMFRIWCALGRPYGGGYDAQVEIRINGTLHGTVTISPKVYETRTQWVEREFQTLNLSTTKAIVSGVSYTVQFKTLNAGNACMLAYAVPDMSGDFTLTTNSVSLVGGRSGPDFADFPAGVNWPARIGIIAAAATGSTASNAAYQAYVGADMDAEAAAVASWLNPIWTEYKPAFNELSASLEVYALAGTYGAGALADTVVRFGDPGANITLQTIRFKQTRHLGRRYALLVDLHIGTSSTGPWTKVARFVPGWADYKWEEFDIDPTALSAGTVYWLRFQTINQNQNDVYAVDPNERNAEVLEQEADRVKYGNKIGLIRGLIDAPTVRNYTNPLGSQYLFVSIDDVVVISVVRSLPFAVALPIPSAPLSVTQSLLFAGVDTYPADIHGDGSWAYDYSYHGDNRLYGYPIISGWAAAPQTPLQTMTQIVYPFGSYYETGVGTLVTHAVQDVDPVLKSVLIAKSMGCGYTIYPVRNDVYDAVREPSCRATEYALARVLVYGDVKPEVTLNSIDVLTGTAFEDVQHEGAWWQVALEPDPAGNATIKHSVQALDYIAFDAYFFKTGGIIEKGALNDGGIYLDILSQTGNFAAGETLTGGTSAATAKVTWATNNTAHFAVRINTVTGTFVKGETVTGSTSLATCVLGVGAAVTYFDDKAWLLARGKKRLLIISNYSFVTGEPDPAIASAVVNAPSTYVPLITSLCTTDSWDGITCNLEAIPQVDRTVATAFYLALADSLHAQKKLLHITAPGLTGTSYDIGSEFWWGWCDHNAIIKYVDAMKVMTYTETGPGTLPGPHMPDVIFTQMYDWVKTHVDSRFWQRILIGCNTYGHLWSDVTDPASADYVDFHGGMAQGILAGAEITQNDGELTWAVRGKAAWFGGTATLRRAARKVVLEGFLGLGIWKADDGDLYDMWPVYPTLGRFRVADFIEEQFPSQWSWGAEGGPTFRTGVVQVDSGMESRNQSWSAPLWKFRLSRQLHSPADNDLLRSFFIVRRGRTVGFRFKDWSDFAATTQSIGTGNGSLTGFQLTKLYQFVDAVNSSTTSWYRVIKKPVVGTVKIYLNAVLQSSGYTINHATGLVSFTVAPTTGVLITADFEFDVPVRFDSDLLNVMFNQDIALYSWSGVGFVEPR